MANLRFTSKQLNEAGRERTLAFLRKDPSFAREVVESSEGRWFTFSDGRLKANHLVRMALDGNDELAVHLMGRKEIREERCIGQVTLAQVAVEGSWKAAMEALKIREVYLLEGVSSSRYVKYVAHVAVFYPEAARFALGCDDLCALENRNGGSLEDYIKSLHRNNTYVWGRAPGPVKGQRGMVFGSDGSTRY